MHGLLVEWPPSGVARECPLLLVANAVRSNSRSVLFLTLFHSFVSVSDESLLQASARGGVMEEALSGSAPVVPTA